MSTINIRKCDMCGESIKVDNSAHIRLFKRYTYDTVLWVNHDEAEFDLCSKCGNAVIDFIKRGGKNAI